MPEVCHRTLFEARDYDLAATLDGGQAFRWQENAGAWEGVVHSRWVSLERVPQGIAAQCLADGRPPDWSWLAHYLQVDADLDQVLSTFPDDPPLRAAVAQCRGLRLLRQDPWECLASFILSSSKQIVQIRQIVLSLCERFGQPVAVPPGHAPEFAFPSAARLAACSEAELRDCKMGFRAPYLLQAARLVADGLVPLETLTARSVDEARQGLLQVPGVGPKIADCVLLYAGGFPTAFPVDVWVMKALRQLYFPKRRPTPARLRQFVAAHFGPHAGYAQQYLFHYIRRSAASENGTTHPHLSPLP